MKSLIVIPLALIILTLSGCNPNSEQEAKAKEEHEASTESRYKPTEKPLDWTKLNPEQVGGEQSEN